MINSTDNGRLNEDAHLEQVEASSETFSPCFDIIESEEGMTFYGDMPGVNIEQLEVRFEDRQLTIHGAVPPRHFGPFMSTEYPVGDFHRVFQIRKPIKADEVSAEYADGVLQIQLPFADELKPRKIKVHTKS